MPNLAIEKMMGKQVVGIDEVGRGSLAGPVTAAAVIIDQKRITKFLYENIDDSKKISPKKRRFFSVWFLQGQNTIRIRKTSYQDALGYIKTYGIKRITGEYAIAFYYFWTAS